jgi:stringent starvation protein B
MNIPTEPQGSSTRPYLLRALHDWCTDNGFTPYIAVHVDASVQVPTEYVKNNEIVLNIGFEATSGLKLGNETIEFKARFGGRPREIQVPVDHVVAIYARENGQGMAFPLPVPAAGTAVDKAGEASPGAAPLPGARQGLRLAKGEAQASQEDEPSEDDDPPDPAQPPGAAGRRPALKRVK